MQHAGMRGMGGWGLWEELAGVVVWRVCVLKICSISNS